jgi:hypothetical protein
MAIGLAEAIRNAWGDAIIAAIDAGAAAGKLRIYDGSRPATGGAATNLLAELTFSDPCAPGAAGGVVTFDAITPDASANASGNATWARAVDSDGNFAVDLGVGASGSGADVELNTVAIVAGAQVSCTSATITEGNP